MNELLAAFENLTAPQAEVISSATTLLSALLVALVAPLTFHLLTRGGVKGFNEAVGDLKQAASRAKTQSDTIGSAMGTITQVSGRVNELGILLASVQEALANTQNTLLEERSSSPPPGDAGSESARERVKTLWRALQERVEQAASSPTIHGSTRARYARMDRRSYWTLIETLLDEGYLTGDRERWRDAYRLGAAAKNQAEVTPEEARRMSEIEQALRDVLPRPTTSSAPEANTPALRMPTAPRDQLGQALRTAPPRRPPQINPEPPPAH